MTVDLQEQTRRDDIYKDLNEIVDKITTLPIFPSLLWVWTFDVLRNIYENSRYEDLAVNDYVDEAVPEGITLKQIFDNAKRMLTICSGVKSFDIRAHPESI